MRNVPTARWLFTRFLQAIVGVLFLQFGFNIGVYAAIDCAHSELREAALKSDPKLQDVLDAREDVLQNLIALRKNANLNGSNMRNGSSVRYIPVVVHVLFENADENVSDAQILSQLNVLNEDFRRIPGSLGFNIHPDGADVCVEFRLTDTDPDSNPTTGITRTQTQVQEFEPAYPSPDEASEGGVDPWDVSRYLNIIVCDLETGLSGFSRAGTGFALSENRDIIAIDYEAFGDKVGTATAPRDFGRVSTHEVGHHLDLLHTFEGNCFTVLGCNTHGDKCCDTPKSNAATYGCPSSQERCNRQTQIENYMDNTDDVCRNLFTNDQSDRMNANLDGYRADLVLPGLIPGQDFFIFGDHVGDYNYVSTSRLIAHGAAPFTPFFAEAGSQLELRARTEVVLEPGFDAEGADIHIFVEQSLPLGKTGQDLHTSPRIETAETEQAWPHPRIELNSSPQPFSTHLRLDFRLERAMQVTAIVFDVHGRKVLDVLEPGRRRGGVHSLELETGDWAEGMYVLKLCVAGHCQVHPLLRVSP